jgi:spermidine synthase
MDRVEVVELEPAIAHVAEVCAPLNHDVLSHPKVRVVFNDGREVLQTSRERYDLIASEPSNPYRAGVANLYTVEFYASVRQRLAPRGLFIQWLQGYEIDSATMRTVLCTAEKAFPHVEIWEAKPSDLVLVCAAELCRGRSQPALWLDQYRQPQLPGVRVCANGRKAVEL